MKKNMVFDFDGFYGPLGSSNVKILAGWKCW